MLLLVTLALVCGTARGADAQSKKSVPALVGTNQLMTITTPAGFVDDVVGFANQRVAYVVAESGVKAELHVVQLGCVTCIAEKKEIVVDLSPVTLRPTTVQLVGQRAFVIGQAGEGTQVAALVELGKHAGKPVYKLGPATHISLITQGGKQRIAVHQAVAGAKSTRHQVELFAIETGRRVARSRPFEVEAGRNKKLDFRVNHWGDGWTRAVGIKGGVWVKKENQRSPDTEATYDLVTGKFVADQRITDLLEQRTRFQVLADAGGTLDFLRMKPDRSGIELWHRGKPVAVTLDQALSQYDPMSLQGVVGTDGSAWLAIKVDPVNAEAVARKKADPEYLDIYRVSADGKAVRKARVLAKGVRHRFGVIDGTFWLLERSGSFDRGGRALTIYQ